MFVGVTRFGDSNTTRQGCAQASSSGTVQCFTNTQSSLFLGGTLCLFLILCSFFCATFPYDLLVLSSSNMIQQQLFPSQSTQARVFAHKLRTASRIQQISDGDDYVAAQCHGVGRAGI